MAQSVINRQSEAPWYTLGGGTMNQIVRVLIIEDSAMEADALRGYLLRYAHEHQLHFAITHLESAMAFEPAAHRADLIFMDIDLPGETGMEAAEALREVDGSTPLIFVTNLAQFAIHGYAVNAVGFIVKSSSYGDFSLCVDRAMRIVTRNTQSTLTVQTHDGIRIIAVNTLAWVEISNHKLSFHLTDGTIVVSRGTLGEVEEKLTALGAPFVRTSASELVNMSMIRHISGYKLEMVDGSLLYLSRGKRKAALATIATYLGSIA